MRLDGIDNLRGIAVIAVVLYHFFVLLELTQSHLFPYIHAFGLIGVPLFFIISGYLIYRSIGNSVERRGRKRGVFNYFLHRLFRIIPAYYFNLFVVLILASFMLNNDFFYSTSFLKQVISNFTFTAYFTHRISGFGFNGAYWTLNIEMLWYLIAPLLFLYIKNTKMLTLLALMSFAYLWMLGHGLLNTFLDLDNTAVSYRLELLYFATQLPGQINYFISGIFIYKYANSVQPTHPRYNYLLAMLLILFFTGVNGYFGISHSFVIQQLFTLVVATLLFTLIYATKIKGLSFLAWIGKISYSLYLWHMPLLFVMKHSEALAHLSLFRTSILFILSLLFISSLSYYFIEEGGFTLRQKVTDKLFDKPTTK